MISSGEIDPDLLEMSMRDDFRRGNAILICLKFPGGMIFSGEVHPDLLDRLFRDTLKRKKSSSNRPCQPKPKRERGSLLGLPASDFS